MRNFLIKFKYNNSNFNNVTYSSCFYLKFILCNKYDKIHEINYMSKKK